MNLNDLISKENMYIVTGVAMLPAASLFIYSNYDMIRKGEHPLNILYNRFMEMIASAH